MLARMKSHEESYRGYSIFIEENPDQYREGYLYCISVSSAIIEDGLEFDFECAVKAARTFIDQQSG
ncbi:hypothetical protein ABHF33_08775 [Chitinibacter sp. FCG-7]|uniref:Uncharacterized protein n=1 Tax=Chitinibacter mangrovi TaxID=3153927 RepID=A0AAU7F3Q4_9NEIS